MSFISTNGTTPSDQFDKPGAPTWHKAVGISLAVASSFFIGASFKKRGLLDANAKGSEPGVGHAYLKNPMWWTGMILMLGGEIFNLVAYAFSPAVLVTPLGAMSVVISATLSSIFLKERLSFSAKVGCAQCVVGAIIIVLYTPATTSTSTMKEFFSYVYSSVFLTYCGVMVAILVIFMTILDPHYGNKWPLVDITICSIMGSFVVISTQGFGSAIVYSISYPEDSQFTHWELYPLIIFVIVTAIAQIHYLNKALNVFSTAVITPIYYVCFTTLTLVGSAMLFRDISFESVRSAITAFLGFIVIVGGVVLLFQYSLKLSKRAKLLQQEAISPESDTHGSPNSMRETEKGTINKRTVSLYASNIPSTTSIDMHSKGFDNSNPHIVINPIVSRVLTDEEHKPRSPLHLHSPHFAHFEKSSTNVDEYSTTSPSTRKRLPSVRKDDPEASSILDDAEMPAGYLEEVRAAITASNSVNSRAASPTRQLEGLIIIPETYDSYEMGPTGSNQSMDRTSSIAKKHTVSSFMESVASTAPRHASFHSEVSKDETIVGRRDSSGSTKNIRASWGVFSLPPMEPDE
ncbi:hypothetical protein HK096_005950 [Nowakowskiella sp. JEL0078]|nr:hypothetical protein HK096_005950 [Nowakowskiella sp. JEL0078]